MTSVPDTTDIVGQADAQPRPLLSVLMPVYNEEKTLQRVVEAVQAVDISKEIILVDDGSRDGSAAIIDDLANGDEVRVYHHSRNMGKGASAMRAASWC